MSLCDRTKQNKIIDTNFYLVALNYQTEDKQNIMNDAKFADNGGCGFILKPDFLRDHNRKDCFENSRNLCACMVEQFPHLCKFLMLPLT